MQMKYKAVTNDGTSPFWYENTYVCTHERDVHDLNHGSMFQMVGLGSFLLLSYAYGRLRLSSGLRNMKTKPESPNAASHPLAVKCNA
jgi:hypothetical protein